MFLDFYKMNIQPFGVTPDPRFLYLGQSHREALASLYCAVEADRGFVALIAQPGLGKTTLTFQLLEKLQEASRTVFLFQTQCSSRELFQYILNTLGIDATGRDLVSMHNKLNEILCREMLAGRRFVLAIDEAQNLSLEVLETIRLLSNFETSQTKMLQILLIGQPQLARKLASPELEQLLQRISVFASLQPFAAEETVRYISHRLQVGGYKGAPLFTPGALQLIAEHSQGIPRKINGLCFSALSLGCATSQKQIDAAVMKEVIADRDVESLQKSNAAQSGMPAPVTVRDVLSVHPRESKRNFGRWALSAAGAAAIVAMGIGVSTFSPARIDSAIEKTSGAWASIRNPAALIGDFMALKSASAPQPSGVNIQAAELPLPEAGQIPASRGATDARTIIVQPGETLRQIIMRTMGDYNVGTIEQVHKLNPAIADFNHIEPGQAIRLSTVPAPVDSTIKHEETIAAGKNSATSQRQ